MRILITGATGFLGFHFTNVAVEQGHQVLCLRRATSISLFEPIIEKQVNWINDDDPKFERKVCEFAPDVLFHAAWGGVRSSDRENSRIQLNNVELSHRLFHAFPYKQIIALGSQAEYGFYTGPVSESRPLKPTMEYAIAKISVFDELRQLGGSKNIEWQWIRIFTVFGEKQTGGLIKLFAEKCYHGETAFDTTLGNQIYSYLYSYDFACAICQLIGSKGKSGVYNLDQIGEEHSNREVIEQIKSLLHSNIQINYGAQPYPTNQIMYMTGNTSKFINAFGMIHHTNFDEALSRTIESLS